MWLCKGLLYSKILDIDMKLKRLPLYNTASIRPRQSKPGNLLMWFFNDTNQGYLTFPIFCARQKYRDFNGSY